MMKPKDAGFFSLHIEKIILLVALLICALLAMMYVISSPNSIKVDGKVVDANKAAKIVEAKAQRLRDGLNGDASQIPDVHIPDYSGEFNERLNEKATSIASSYAPLGNPGTDMKLVQQSGDIPKYYLPTPPMAESLAVRIGNAVLDNVNSDQILNEIIQATYTNNPENFRYASVKAEFPIDAWIERLTAENVDISKMQYEAVVLDEDGNPVVDENGNVVTEMKQMQAMPKVWWQPMLAVTAVVLEREELDPNTGEWVNRQLVSNMPTQIAYRPDDERYNGHATMAKKTAQLAVQEIKMRQVDICRPEFLPMAFPLNWVPPDAKKLSPEEEKELYKIRKNIARYEKQLTRMQENLEKLRKRDQMMRERSNSRPSRGNTGRSRNTGGGMTGGGMPGGMEMGGMEGGGGRGGMTRTRSPRTSGNRDQSSTIQEQMRTYQQKLIEEIEKREILLGRREKYDPNQAGQNPNMYGGDMMGAGMGMGAGMPMDMGMMMGEMDMGMMGGMPGRGGFARQISNAVESQYEQKEDGTRVIKVWAHDITIQPGKTYRYRVIVSVLNPLFGQHRVSAEQKENNYYKLTMVPSEEERMAGEWSDPVTPDPQSYFFLVGNSANSARVEVWALNRGKWLSKEFTFEPGDAIGGFIEDDSEDSKKPVMIPVSSGAVMVDMIAATQGQNAQLLYVDPASNAIAYRDANSDKDSPTRIRIQNEAISYDELLIERDRDNTTNNANMMGPDMMMGGDPSMMGMY